MVLKYDIEISEDAIKVNFDRICSRIFKLLPDREEGKDWKTPLHTLIIEIYGMDSLLNDQVSLFRLLSRLESLLLLDNEDDFVDFRKGIFECLNLLKRLEQCL